MGLSRRQFTKEFKLAAVRRLEQGISIGEAARALEVNPNVLHRWRREFRQGPGNVFPGHGKARWSEGRIAELERKVGQQTLEIDFLKPRPENSWASNNSADLRKSSVLVFSRAISIACTRLLTC
jgi:transposase-like protein